MEYGATIWNPYLKGDIEKLERILNSAIRIAKKDYKSRETGAITRLREDLELETLEERRLSLRLILMYKVVEGLVPVSYSSFPPSHFPPRKTNYIAIFPPGKMTISLAI